MATHAHTTPTTTARRFLPRLGAVTGRRTPEAPRRGLLALLAGMSVMVIPPTTPAKGEPTTVPPLPAPQPAQLPTDLHDAQRQATTLAVEARRARAELERRIGPRGVTVGTLTLPNGKTVPIHLADPENVKRLWRSLPRELTTDRAARVATVAVVQSACEAWDKEAERAGVRELERRAVRAENYVRRLLHDAMHSTPAVA